MKKNKLKTIILILLIFTLLIFALSNNVFAENIINPDNYKPGNIGSATDADMVKNIGNVIIGFIRIIGSILSVIVLSVMGIKYMIGSVEEKAQYKKSMMPYVIGAIMVFGITNILGIFSEIFMNLFFN